MRHLVLLVLCATSCLASSLEQRRRLEHLKRELEIRLIEREMENEEVDLEDTYDELESRYLGTLMEREEEEKEMARRQVIDGCVQGDIVFVVDSSGSIKIENWHHVLDFINDLVDKMNVSQYGTRVGMLTYGNKGNIQFNLNTFTDGAPMKTKVSASKFLDENTNTSGGIYIAMNQMFTVANGDRPAAPNIMIIITDGVSTYDNKSTIPYANEAKAKGILVVSIGVGNLTSQAELEGMASVGKSGKPIVMQVGSYEMLDLVNQQLAYVSCGKEPPPNITAPANVTVPVNVTQPVPDPQPQPPLNTTCVEGPVKEVVCLGTTCSNKCKFGFAQDVNGCLSANCTCLPEQKACP